jgi:serine/threonine protein kinase
MYVLPGLSHLLEGEKKHYSLSGSFTPLKAGESASLTLSDFIQYTGVLKLPIRWSAPEVLMNRSLAKPSDVWSFGVAMWEVYCWEMPYKDLTTEELMSQLPTGKRLPKKDIVPMGKKEKSKKE